MSRKIPARQPECQAQFHIGEMITNITYTQKNDSESTLTKKTRVMTFRHEILQPVTKKLHRTPCYFNTPEISKRKIGKNEPFSTFPMLSNSHMMRNVFDIHFDTRISPQVMIPMLLCIDNEAPVPNI